MKRCPGCTGSGTCDPCDGYGTHPAIHPHAGDGPDCEACDATGWCPDCAGTGESNGTTSTEHDRTTTPIGSEFEVITS